MILGFTQRYTWPAAAFSGGNQYFGRMKKFIEEYAAFNVWANERICSVVATISDEQMSREIISSFSSIRSTLLHLWGAQEVWIRRMEGLSPGALPTENFQGSRQEIIDGMLAASHRLKELAEAATEQSLLEVKKYSTLKGGIVTSSLYQVFAHVFNHSTYHRGQLVTMFRQAGVSEIPQTDLIYYYRSLR